MRFQRLKLALVVCAAVVALAGCFYRKGPDELHYLGSDGPDYYKDVATSIEFPTTEEQRPEQVTTTNGPHTIANRQKDQVWDLTLSQALELALANNKIIRTAGSFTTPGNALLTNPNGSRIGLRSGDPGNGRVVWLARCGSGPVGLRRAACRHQPIWLQPEHRQLARAKRGCRSR